jgi:hypothetical protein
MKTLLLLDEYADFGIHVGQGLGMQMWCLSAQTQQIGLEAQNCRKIGISGSRVDDVYASGRGSLSMQSYRYISEEGV